MFRSFLGLIVSLPLLGQTLTVTALGYRVIPHEYTGIFRTPGQSNTTCDGSGVYMGNTVTATANCSTFSTPAENHAVTRRTAEIYNQVGANGMVYTIRCTANWVGSNCSSLTPGDTFEAEVQGTTMWIEGRKGGNLGKEARARFQLLDMRPMSSSVSANMQPAPPVAVAARVREPEGQSRSVDPPPAVATPKGIVVRFVSMPSGAEVDVDGDYWGTTPTADLTRLPAGTHTITVKKIGYKPWERRIELAPGDDRSVNAELEVDLSKPRISGLN